MNYQDPTPPASEAASLTADRAPVSASRMRRAMVWAVVVAIVVVGLLVGFDLFRKQMMQSFFAANKPPPVSVSFETVSAGTVARTLSAIGSIAAVHQVTISPEAQGTVTKIAFLPGQPVKAGDLIVQLNDTAEQADLANFRAQQKLAAVNLKRARDLAGSSAASQAQVDLAQSQYDIATAGIARSEALIAQKAVRAPFDGTLGVRMTEVGHYLERGARIVQITNLDDLYVEFTLPEQALPQLHLGQEVALTVDAYPGRTFNALIAVIDPQISVSTRTVMLQAVAPNPDLLLKPGMFATVAVTLPPEDGQLTVSETALSYSLYGNAVYVVEDGGADAAGQPSLIAKRTNVETGASVNGRVVIAKGLRAGDRVVTTGLGKLYDGAHLNLNMTPALVKPDVIPRP
jgi:multidrug efflux system membrane fusion protein